VVNLPFASDLVNVRGWCDEAMRMTSVVLTLFHALRYLASLVFEMCELSTQQYWDSHLARSFNWKFVVFSFFLPFLFAKL